MAQTHITSLQKEGRKFKPAAVFARASPCQFARPVSQTLPRIHPGAGKVLGPPGQGTGLVQALEKSPAMEQPFAKWFVGGQLNVSYNCLDRHLGTAAANKAALIWEGEPAGPGQSGRGTHPHLQTTPSRSLPLRQRPQTPRHPERRPRHHLPAHGAGSRHRHARLRPHRRRPFGRLRRLQRPIRRRPHFRLPGQTGHHRRRRLSPRQHRAR